MRAVALLSAAALVGVSYATTGETVTATSLQVTAVNAEDGVGAGTDSYTYYTGDGSTGAGWPAASSWVSFNEMFEANKAHMSISCDWMGVPDDSDDEIQELQDAINQVAQETFVDHRFILAVVLQESNGCVRVHTTGNGVTNPGLMQSHAGSGTCNDNGSVQNPCPDSEIVQMIEDGTAGTDSGDGLANCINNAQTSDVSAYYRAARIYNSGSIAADGNLSNANGATACYASDIANRLTGWVNAASTCA
ncbi:hypothetical protein BGW36DRAFT_285615 [Talaromyces proteolyticus]|uniref:Transglycosylase SLT domain-containing protein n=1 Tax=Talaromyces proteolyticus TaxID=1131652 RepID=A0AAD4Q762_9EURO|nr:uncharacterized protein BGW36DRAFT_285615 [Talaromyces proteolyticus]KAH8706017.1 hypothetical protein BGW36DRAFT_285615 [Talaromyces proteolyticus]